MHAIDPARMLSFEDGGPPVWSVGFVDVPGPNPYRLFVTYGFSHILSPQSRGGFEHEFSLAVPAGTQTQPWADALLRHLSRYVLANGADLRIGDVLPGAAPITRIPFQPEDHDKMPTTPLVGIVVAPDPVISTIQTPAGEIEVRRFVGIHEDELNRTQTWSGSAFAEEMQKRDPLLLTDLGRPSLMADTDFKAIVDERAKTEQSLIPFIQVDVAWADTGTELVIDLPGVLPLTDLLDAWVRPLPSQKPRGLNRGPIAGDVSKHFRLPPRGLTGKLVARQSGCP